MIRTPDQRLRVFVSSTLGELADERQAASRAIAANGRPSRAQRFEPGASHRLTEQRRISLNRASNPVEVDW